MERGEQKIRGEFTGHEDEKFIASFARSRQTPHQEVIQCLAADTVCGSGEEEISLDDG